MPWNKSSMPEERPFEVVKPANEDDKRMTEKFGRFSLRLQLYSHKQSNSYMKTEIITNTSISLPSQAEPPISKRQKTCRVTPRKDIYKVDVKEENGCIVLKESFSNTHGDHVLNQHKCLRENRLPVITKNGMRRTKSLSDLDIYKKDKHDKGNCSHPYELKCERKLSSVPSMAHDSCKSSAFSNINRCHSAERIRRKYIRQENRLLRVVVFLLGYFTFAWLPFIIWVFVEMGCEDQCNINRYIK